MKRSILFIITLITALSLCACSTASSKLDGEAQQDDVGTSISDVGGADAPSTTEVKAEDDTNPKDSDESGATTQSQSTNTQGKTEPAVSDKTTSASVQTNISIDSEGVEMPLVPLE